MKMMGSDDYSISYIVKMAKVFRQTFYKWKKDFAE